MTADATKPTSEAPVQPTPATPAKPRMPKWETDTRERLRAAIKKFSKPLADFIALGANEADTRFLVTDFLCEASATTSSPT